MRLYAIDEIEGDLTTPGYSKKLKPEFLKAHPTLMVDTRHFDADVHRAAAGGDWAMWTSRPMACCSTARTFRHCR